MPPKTANSGQSTAPMRRFGEARNSTSSRPGRSRIRTIAACAIVKDRVAPNA